MKKSQEQYIEHALSLPLTTNKIEVSVDREKFFSKYAVISYYSTDKTFKATAYEKLSTLPFISVAGFRSRWSNTSNASNRFFILVKKEKSAETLKSLRDYPQICSSIDMLNTYPEQVQKRILASLAINALGKRTCDKRMYNNASLLLCDDYNFLVPRTRNELVCLKIEVNEYMNLTAKTTSFSNPKSIEQLRKNGDCAFEVSQEIYGQWWDGLAVKPVIVKNLKANDIQLENIYIQKKKFSNTKNLVPYWPYDPQHYTHGKLFAICQIVESVNKEFKNLLDIQFKDYEVCHYDECQSGKSMLESLQDYFLGKTIRIEDPFQQEGSKELITKFKQCCKEILPEYNLFTRKASAKDMIVKLCEPIEDETVATHYTKSLYRLPYSGNAMQHLVYDANKKEQKPELATVRRILIELLVKDCLVNRELPQGLSKQIQDWQFLRYKISDGQVIGASLKAHGTTMELTDFGFSSDYYTVDYFSQKYLNFGDTSKINGARDYMALIRNGNVYLIVDTEEIPILDVSLIDEGYDAVVNKGETLSMFKRTDNIHDYLRGYIGIHVWKTEGLYGEENGSFSYIVGTYKQKPKFMIAQKMDKMPRARRIFTLHAENPSFIEQDTHDIIALLKFGFGRWNEMMTYPFPFKFLQEYLDDLCETSIGKHWSEISFRG